MSGRTRLFQAAGSPLIQGHSRYERRFWTQWLLACLVAVPGVYLVHGLMTVLRSPQTPFDSFDSIATWLADPAIPLAATLGASAVAVWLARFMGWPRPWLYGGLIAWAIGAAVLVFA